MHPGYGRSVLSRWHCILESREPKLNPGNISISYAVFAVIWIWFSELLLHDFSLSERQLFFFSAAKGTLFIAVSTCGLYVVLRRMVRHIKGIQEEHEAELRESEERFRAFMDNSPAIAWARDEQGRYVYFNHTYERRLGTPPLRSTKKPEDDTLPADVARQFHDELVLANERPVELTEKTRNEDGSTTIWRTNKFSFHDSQGHRFVGGMGVDVTEAVRTEAALRESEEQLRLFVEHAPAAMAMFDREMRYLRVSDRWLRDYGLTGRNILGLCHYDVFPEIPERWKEAHRRGMAGDILRKETDPFRRADGSVQWLRWEILPWHDRAGKIGGIVISTEDITGDKRVEAELKQLQAEFQEAQKMEAIARLTGGIAHDFNNMLTVIMAQSELLQLGSHDERSLRRISSIHQASLRAADLTRQLLAFSRKQVLQPSVQNVGEIVAGLTDMLDRILGEDIELEIRTSNHLWPVLVDRSQIEQVIMNLVVNARDAMPMGGKLTLETCNLQVDKDVFFDDTLLPQGNYVQLSVTDTGSGMTSDVREKIFEPFFTTKPHGKGTGLGLATVFGIVKQSGGLVTVETEVGKGTCFRVYLPYNSATPEPVAAEIREAYPESGFQCSILLVDDEVELCSVVGEYLESAGHKVWKADSLQSALAVVEQQKDNIDVVVTDLVLAEGNGKELADRLRSSGCSARHVFISGYTDDVIADHGSIEPDTIFLQKPFGKEALLEKVWQAYQARN